MGTTDNLHVLGDRIAALTVKEAKELSNYLKNVYGIEAPERGAVIQQPGSTEEPEEEKTEFSVILESFGEKKVPVIKALRLIHSGLSLGDAKKLAESAPIAVKEDVPMDEAKEIKAMLEEAGGKASIK